MTLCVVWGCLALGALSISLLPQVLPPLGRTPIVVTHATDLPSVSVGSLLVLSEVDPLAIVSGDAIVFRTAAGDLVVDQVSAPASHSRNQVTFTPYNADSGEAVSIPDTAIVGKLELALPAVGEAMLTLGSTSGAVWCLGVLGVLMLMIWLAEDAITTLGRAPARPMPTAELAH